MKALVLSGGSATRLRPLSYRMPKQLVPVANKPVIHYVLEGLAALGINEVGLVVGPWRHRIAEVVGDGSRWGLRIAYLNQDRPRGLADCVRVAGPFLGDDDFVMYLGDNVLPDGIAEHAAQFRESRPDAQVVVRKVVDPRAFGVVELSQDGVVGRLVEKPRRPRSNLALVGVYFFTPAIHDAVRAITPSRRGELEITDAIQWLVSSGNEVHAVEHRGYWKDTGSLDDILDCNRHLLGRLHPAIAGEIDAFSAVDSNIIVEPTARIVRSRIEGPSIIGAGTVITDSRVGPYAAVGPDCLLRDTWLTDSIVVGGAPALTGRRLTSTLVGPSVRPEGLLVA